MEQILIMGESGSGKSTAVIATARFCHEMGKDVQFYVFDGDNAYQCQAEDLVRSVDGEILNAAGNVNVVPCNEWLHYRDGMRCVLDIVRPQDWVVVDRISTPWDLIKEWYVTHFLKTDWDEFFADFRENHLKGGDPLLKHYTAINNFYTSWQRRFNPFAKCNVLCCTDVKEVITGKDKSAGIGFKDKAATLNAFEGLGWKPAGHNTLANQFNTILYIEKAWRKWRITTVRERAVSRPNLEKETLESFPRQYLLKVARWRAEGGKAEVVASE